MRKKLKPGDALLQGIISVLFGLFTLSCIYPFYYLFINTISSNDLSAAGYIKFYPQQIHFDNYSKVLRISGLSHAALVSVYRTVVGTFLTVGASAFLGYLFTKKEMWGRRIWYRSRNRAVHRHHTSLNTAQAGVPAEEDSGLYCSPFMMIR